MHGSINWQEILRSSEFWVAIAAGLGQVLCRFGLVEPGDWAHFLWPAIVYIIARLTGKVARRIVPG